MKCFDKEKSDLDAGLFGIHGDYNADNSRNLMVVFDKCDQRKEDKLERDKPGSGVKCKNKEEIDEWIGGKYILVLANERTYLQ